MWVIGPGGAIEDNRTTKNELTKIDNKWFASVSRPVCGKDLVTTPNRSCL
jgi:hypothetical protein